MDLKEQFEKVLINNGKRGGITASGKEVITVFYQDTSEACEQVCIKAQIEVLEEINEHTKFSSAAIAKIICDKLNQLKKQLK